MKLFKRGKDRPGPDEEPRHDPRSAFALAPLPRHAGPPASSTPLADQLSRGGPGVTDGYVVLPRGLAEQMPLPWQQQAASVLAQFHHTHRGLSWPEYRVLPSREERLVDLDEEQLAEAGYVVEMDVNGELVYRERNGRKVPDPERHRVLVTCLDPVQPTRPPQPEPSTPGPGTPVPMNIGPQPKWDVVPSKAHVESPPLPAAPPPVAAAPAQPVAEPVDDATPPRGIPQQQPEPPPQPEPEPQPEVEADVEEAKPADPLDWFAEPPSTEPESDDPSFGPSGDPLEKPYRFPS